MNIALNGRRAKNIFVTTVILLSGGALVFCVEQIIQSILGENTHGWVYFLLFFVLLAPFGFFTDFALRRVGYILGSQVKMSLPESEDAKKFILTGYSPIRDSQTQTAVEQAKTAVEISKELTFANIALPCREYNDAKFPKLGSWQQSARTIFHHRAKVEAIYLLRPDTCDEQFDLFKQFLANCLKDEDRADIKLIGISHWKNSDRQFSLVNRKGQKEDPSYDDYDYVYEGLRHGLDLIKAQAGENFSDQDVCVDVTPGYKPYSIAAAILTLNQRLKFSYVTMDGHLKFYDADIQFAK